MITKGYACYNLDDIDRSNSSYVGVYPLLAKEIIKDSGVVYAACYDDKLDVAHKRIVRESEIPESQGSKYVSSNLSSVFSDILKDIKEGKKILFVGTPCQCAGLESFLCEKRIDRTTYLLVDFICHGIPSSKAWNAYKDSLNANGKKLASVNMRNKSTGWTNSNYSWEENYTDGTCKLIPRREAPYMKGMLANLFIRPSCFNCRFKGIERCTDITLGDYWGIWKHTPEMDDNKGTSLVLVHTENGAEILDAISCNVKIMETEIENAIKGNACLVESTKYNPKRDVFFERLNRGEDFIDVVKDLTKTPIKNKIKNKIYSLISKI